MSVSTLPSAVAHGYTLNARTAFGNPIPGARDQSLARSTIGQSVRVQIVARLAERRFVAVHEGSRYVVESSVPLAVGQSVDATVTAVEGVVQLRYQGGELRAASEGTADELTTQRGGASQTQGLKQLEQRYHVKLDDAQRAWVAALGAQSADPAAVSIGALFLQKVSASLDEQAVRALYSRLAWDRSAEITDGVDLSALLSAVQRGDATAVQDLADELADAVDSDSTSQLDTALADSAGSLAPDQQSFDQPSSERRDAFKYARELLNTQDAGALAYRYGSLPVIVSGHLVELDLVVFRERRPQPGSAALKKLVMTLRTDTLGTVEIVAQSTEGRLSVSIASPSAEATEQLSSHAREVRELVGRLGWNVDSVAYRLSARTDRAASHLAQHVLKAGTVDALL
jgi:hypothetical protein